MRRVNPVGAKASGSAARHRSIVVDGSTAETSRSTRGRTPRARRPRRDAAQADLGAGGAVGVVEDRARHAPAGDLAQVADGRGARQPAGGRVAGRDRRGRTSSRSSDQRGSRRSTTPDTPARRRPVRGGVDGPAARTDGASDADGPGSASCGDRRRSVGWAASGPTTAGRARAGPAVPRATGRDSSWPSPGNSSSSRDAAALELDEEAGALLERAAPVLLGVDDQRRGRDPPRRPRQLRRYCSGSVPRYRSGKNNPMSEDPTKLTGSSNARSLMPAVNRVVRPRAGSS